MVLGVLFDQLSSYVLRRKIEALSFSFYSFVMLLAGMSKRGHDAFRCDLPEDVPRCDGAAVSCW